MLSKSHQRRPAPRLLVAALLALGLSAVAASVVEADDPPAAPAKTEAESARPTFTVGKATIRWHLDATPDPGSRTAELIEKYRQLTAERWGDEAPKSRSPEPAEIETRPDGIRMARIPAGLIHSMAVRVGGDGGFAAYCSNGTVADNTAEITAGATSPAAGEEARR